MFREGFDDWKRHGHDKEENNKTTHVIRDEESELSMYDAHSVSTIITETMSVGGIGDEELFSSSLLGSNNNFLNKAVMAQYNMRAQLEKWKDVKVGDILKIDNDEWIPADIVLIAVDNAGPEAFVETMALDGETNLKLKSPHPEVSKLATKAANLKNLASLFTIEDPNNDLYNFKGQFSLNGRDYALTNDNIVYRGSTLRNTNSVLGLWCLPVKKPKSE